MKNRMHSVATKARPRRGVPNPDVPIVDIEGEGMQMPDQPFAEGIANELDPDLRHRLVSEAAFHHLSERGYDEGAEVEDWLAAEAEVDHVLLNPTSPEAPPIRKR